MPEAVGKGRATRPMQFGRLRFVLILALLASNLLVGVLSLLFLRSMEQRYAALLDRSVPLINNLRTLTRELSGVQRLARRISDPQNEPAWASLLNQMKDASDSAKAHAFEISAMESLKDSRHVATMARFGREYDDKADRFLALARAGKIAEANQYNVEVLRPAYDRYMDAVDDAANYVEREGVDLRARYAEDSRLFGGFLLAAAGWPLLAAAGLVVVMALLVLGLFTAVFFPRLFVSKRPAA
ncbi:MCP four helix bundle domain-containing protein [Opitutus sp. GAS368]|uniref:MCP four helix bundle domain-containing protein n=1 Tax=Opitutus sp. GAS368 TaxID=1882749 RepID=UPI00087A770C|nr:MCP four helix bundle domain-containing protein [Opitutus sp. GAS368]SDR75420.1 Four helix bundle sensory module for signal transduction [Opitutus sp. GAS368]